MAPEIAIVRGTHAPAGKGAVRIAAGDDLALVQMSVHIEQHRPDVSAGEIYDRCICRSLGAGGSDPFDPLALNQDIDDLRTVIVHGSLGNRLRQETSRRARLPDPIASGVRDGHSADVEAH